MNEFEKNHVVSDTSDTLGVVGWGIIGCGDVVETKNGPGTYLAEGSELVGIWNRTKSKAEALGDAPVFDQGYLIACRAEEFIVVRDNADSDSRIAHARDLDIYSTHVAIIQATRRLVENHRAGTRNQAGSDGKPLALPA